MRRSKGAQMEEDMKTLFPIAAFAALALTVSPAGATQPAPAAAPILIVHTADLDLSRPAGVSTLDRRIAGAVRAACGAASDVDLAGKNRVARCRTDTMASVAAQRDQAIALAQRASQVQLAAK
jgi:UrcA family protein